SRQRGREPDKNFRGDPRWCLDGSKEREGDDYRTARAPALDPQPSDARSRTGPRAGRCLKDMRALAHTIAERSPGAGMEHGAKGIPDMDCNNETCIAFLRATQS